MFKEGDKVKCIVPDKYNINKSRNLTKGTYTVEEVNPRSGGVKLLNGPIKGWFYSSSRFIPYTEQNYEIY